jgi:hypothetical protein
MVWAMEAPAQKLCDRLWPTGEQKLPHEILKLEEKTAGIVVDVDGVDYILTMTPLPIQRPRPTGN